MKKFISILLTLFMLILAAVPSFAAKTVTFTASDSEVFAGDEFTVDIFVSDYSRLKSATLIIEYDEKAVQFLDLNIGAIVTAGSNAVSFKDVKNSGKSYIQIDYKDSYASLSSAGKLLSLTFVANDSAIGKTDIKLSVSGNQITVASGSVTPEFKNGQINIINNEPVSSSKPVPSSEESSSSEPTVSEDMSNAQNAVQNSAESPSQNVNSNSASDKKKDKDNNNTYLIIAAAVITVVVIIAVMLDPNGKGTGKSRKKKRKNKRKSRR